MALTKQFIEMQEAYERKIADLEAKLAESENEVEEYIAVRDDKIKVINRQTAKINELQQQLAENTKYKEWVLEFLEKHNINTDSTPEYSENPIIEYCEQVKDFRECDNKEIEMLLSAKQASEEQILDIVSNTAYQHNPIQLEIEQLKQRLAESEKTNKRLLNEAEEFRKEANFRVNKLKQQLAEKDNALQLACDELDDAKDMLRDAGKNEWASLLNTSADYFKSKAKGKK